MQILNNIESQLVSGGSITAIALYSTVSNLACYQAGIMTAANFSYLPWNMKNNFMGIGTGLIFASSAGAACMSFAVSTSSIGTAAMAAFGGLG